MYSWKRRFVNNGKIGQRLTYRAPEEISGSGRKQ